MGFFDKISDFARSTSKEIDKRAKNFATVNKLQGQIAEAESSIRNNIAALGEQYYQAHKDEADCEFAEICASINAAKDAIETLKAEVEKLKGLQRCPNCGAAVASDSAFCPKCGTKMPEIVVPVEEVPAAEAVEEAVEAVEEVVEPVEEAAEEVVEAVEEN